MMIVVMMADNDNDKKMMRTMISTMAITTMMMRAMIMRTMITMLIKIMIKMMMFDDRRSRVMVDADG
jgi:hypothetical protein